MYTDLLTALVGLRKNRLAWMTLDPLSVYKLLTPGNKKNGLVRILFVDVSLPPRYSMSFSELPRPTLTEINTGCALRNLASKFYSDKKATSSTQLDVTVHELFFVRVATFFWQDDGVSRKHPKFIVPLLALWGEYLDYFFPRCAISFSSSSSSSDTLALSKGIKGLGATASAKGAKGSGRGLDDWGSSGLGSPRGSLGARKDGLGDGGRGLGSGGNRNEAGHEAAETLLSVIEEFWLGQNFTPSGSSMGGSHTSSSQYGRGARGGRIQQQPSYLDQDFQQPPVALLVGLRMTVLHLLKDPNLHRVSQQRAASGGVTSRGSGMPMMEDSLLHPLLPRLFSFLRVSLLRWNSWDEGFSHVLRVWMALLQPWNVRFMESPQEAARLYVRKSLDPRFSSSSLSSGASKLGFSLSSSVSGGFSLSSLLGPGTSASSSSSNEGKSGTQSKSTSSSDAKSGKTSASGTSSSSSSRDSRYHRGWDFYLLECFPFYTVLLRDFLTRVQGFDLRQTQVEMLHEVLGVYMHNIEMVETLKEIELATLKAASSPQQQLPRSRAHHHSTGPASHALRILFAVGVNLKEYVPLNSERVLAQLQDADTGISGTNTSGVLDHSFGQQQQHNGSFGYQGRRGRGRDQIPREVQWIKNKHDLLSTVSHVIARATFETRRVSKPSPAYFFKPETSLKSGGSSLSRSSSRYGRSISSSKRPLFPAGEGGISLSAYIHRTCLHRITRKEVFNKLSEVFGVSVEHPSLRDAIGLNEETSDLGRTTYEESGVRTRHKLTRGAGGSLCVKVDTKTRMTFQILDRVGSVVPGYSHAESVVLRGSQDKVNVYWTEAHEGGEGWANSTINVDRYVWVYLYV
jgi:hypothetical protein